MLYSLQFPRYPACTNTVRYNIHMAKGKLMALCAFKLLDAHAYGAEMLVLVSHWT